MKPLAEISLVVVPSKARNEREEYIQKFADRVNASRERAGFKKLTTRTFAVKLSHLTIQDLHAFWKQCDGAENFSRCFWGKLKTNKP